jgi:hypothetical protein
MAIDLPVLLNDGSTLLMDHDFAARLREGDASVGWVGDDRLGVYFADGRLEIRRLDESGELVVVMRSKPGVRMLGTETLRVLAEHDSRSRRQYNVVEDVIAHNERLEAGHKAAAREKYDEVADRLHWALLKDLGATEGSGSTKRLMTLPAAPWKRDKK